MPEPSAQPRDAVRVRAVLLRWLVVLAVGVGGALGVQRAMLWYGTRAAARLVLADWARFEGCLVGVPAPSEGETPDRVLAMALGTGDPLWPHSCAPALTRLVREAEQVAEGDPHARSLAAAARQMENALGPAMQWAERVQRGSREPPAWVGAYVALRREVAAFAARRGKRVPPPEAPRRPRVPRTGRDPPPIPEPVALPGGDEADLVDASATPEEFAVLLRDRRSRYSVCVLPLPSGRDPEESAPRFECRVLSLPATADPREMHFVPSARGAHLAIWDRAPSNVRSLVDIATDRVVLLARGRTDATRDFWVGARAAMALRSEGVGGALVVAREGSARELPLPASYAAPLTEERALVGTAAGAALLWLDAISQRNASLRVLPLGSVALEPHEVFTVASWGAPRLAAIDRRLLPCAVPGGPAYVLVGDARGGWLYSSSDGVRFLRLGAYARGLDRDTHLVCDERGAAVLHRGPGTLEAAVCEGTGSCVTRAALGYERDVAAARVAGLLVVADGGGAGGTMRVRRIDVGSGSEAMSSIVGRVPEVRALRIVAHGSTVLVFVAASRTYAFVSQDAGTSFVPALVDE